MEDSPVMKVFLSWSGETSRKVASALQKWLPYMLQPLRPWLSTEISKGDRWGDALETELKDAQYAIICVTKYNISKPWLNFESGVLSRFIDRAFLTPFLFRVDPSRLMSGPLGQFQFALCNKDDALRLIQSINKRLGADRIDDTVVQAAFNIWWVHLEEELNSITPDPQEEDLRDYKWLNTLAELAIHQQNKDTTAIWIITEDLTKHATKYEVRENLKANLERGVTYRFYVPAETATLIELESLKRDSKGRLDYKCFERQDFYKQAATDYIMFNPGGRLLTFFRLMIDGGDDLWVEVDETSAIKFKDRFADYWDKGKSITTQLASPPLP